VQEVLDKALAGEQTANYEFPLFTKEGSRVDVLLNATSRRDASGAIVGVVGVGQDITELNQVRQEQARVAEDLTQLIDTANAPIFGIDAEGLVNEWNQTAERITGFSKAETMGRPLVETFITGEYKLPVQEVLDKALVGEQTANYEFPLYTKKGDRVMVLLNATTRRDAEGKVSGVIGIGQDITELDAYRTEMEQRVQERSRELNTMFTLSPDAFVLVNKRDDVVYANPAFTEMTGLKSSDYANIDGSTFSKRFFRLFDHIQSPKPLEIGNQPYSKSIHLSRPTKKVLSVSFRIMLDAGGDVQGKVLYFRDITHETEVDRMKSEFLSTAAHELRTPLASILGFSELLLVRDYAAEQRADLIKTIHRQSLNLKHLLDELLDLARIESRAGKDFNMEPNSMEFLVKQTCEEFSGLETYRPVSIQLPTGWPLVEFDFDKVHQVFTNVIGNAYKYSPGGGDVTLSTAMRGSKGREEFGIVVTDQGIGMSDQQRRRVGERFFRADESGTIPGTGLGMAVVKEVMGIHGGKVEIESDLGAGTTVTLWFHLYHGNEE